MPDCYVWLSYKDAQFFPCHSEETQSTKSLEPCLERPFAIAQGDKGKGLRVTGKKAQDNNTER